MKKTALRCVNNMEKTLGENVYFCVFLLNKALGFQKLVSFSVCVYVFILSFFATSVTILWSMETSTSENFANDIQFSNEIVWFTQYAQTIISFENCMSQANFSLMEFTTGHKIATQRSCHPWFFPEFRMGADDIHMVTYFLSNFYPNRINSCFYNWNFMNFTFFSLLKSINLMNRDI